MGIFCFPHWTVKLLWSCAMSLSPQAHGASIEIFVNKNEIVDGNHYIIYYNVTCYISNVKHFNIPTFNM